MGQLKNFVTKLTPKQLVDFMIKSIEEPVVELEFSTYGMAVKSENAITCFGCAATNFALKAANISYKDIIKNVDIENAIDDFTRRAGRSILFDEDESFLYEFEHAIDCLRRGMLIKSSSVYTGYNNWAALIDLPFLPLATLPLLNNDNWRKNIKAYKKYAESLVTTKYYRHKSVEHAKLFESIVGSKTWYNQYNEKIAPIHIIAKKSARTIILKPDGSYFIQGAAGHFYYTEKPNHNV